MLRSIDKLVYDELLRHGNVFNLSSIAKVYWQIKGAGQTTNTGENYWSYPPRDKVDKRVKGCIFRLAKAGLIAKEEDIVFHGDARVETQYKLLTPQDVVKNRLRNK